MFDDRVGKEMQLEADVLQRLRDVDARYQKEYTSFGSAPSTNSGYKALSDRRDSDVRGILTPEQYKRWESMQNRGQMDRGTNGSDTDGGMKDGNQPIPRTNGTGTTPTRTPAPAPTPKTVP